MAKEYVILTTEWEDDVNKTIELGRYPDTYIMNPLQNGSLQVLEILKQSTLSKEAKQPPKTKLHAMYASGTWEKVILLDAE